MKTLPPRETGTWAFFGPGNRRHYLEPGTKRKALCGREVTEFTYGHSAAAGDDACNVCVRLFTERAEVRHADQS